MIAMSPMEYVEYRNATNGCTNIVQIHYKVQYKNISKTGIIKITNDMRSLVPAYYGSVVYAAIESVNWYDILEMENPQSTTQLSNEGVGFVTSQTPLIMWTPVGYSENQDTIYVEGVLPANESTD